ncbi:hypothetical protein WKK05_36490 (plasmid) [Nostoc sp. UHCC 0302]|uniref:hypothetical protein n=1 Tax=Nostoc sp. UHCC 0302 TaxID=3134896 RepID=UPI00311C96F4
MPKINTAIALVQHLQFHTHVAPCCLYNSATVGGAIVIASGKANASMVLLFL